MTVQNIQCRNRASGRLVQRRSQFPFGDMRANRLQIRACDQHHAIGLEDAYKLSQGHGHLMRVEMLDVVAGENMGPSKLEKAQKLQIPIISDSDLLKMINNS